MTTETRLWICGLGVHPPLETTLETLHALEGCAEVFTDVRDARTFEWLRGYCKKLSRARDAASVLSAAGRGRAALAVWGHPQFSSRLALEVEREAQRRGIRYEVLGAVSPVGSAFARSISFLGGDYGYQGIQAYELEALLESPGSATERLPLVVYSEGAPAKDWKRLARELAGRYPEGHEVRLYPVGPGGERILTIQALGRQALEGAVLLIPPHSPLPQAGEGEPPKG